MKENKVQFIAITAMAVALTYVFTAFVNVRLPIAANGGLIHLGNVPLFIMAILFGKKTGAIAGGVGMGLFDLLSGWTAWAPFTFTCGRRDRYPDLSGRERNPVSDQAEYKI